MFTSFDERVFRHAITEKDFARLKINAVSAISYDPTFEKGEANAVLEILKNEVPEIFEEYREGEYEERLERSKWDKRYFSKLTYWFQENFSEDRIPLIKEVGREVHSSAQNKEPEEQMVRSGSTKSGKTGTSGKVASDKKIQEENRGKLSNFIHALRGKPPLVRGLVAVIVVVGAVVLITAAVRAVMEIYALLMKLFTK